MARCLSISGTIARTFSSICCGVRLTSWPPLTFVAGAGAGGSPVPSCAIATPTPLNVAVIRQAIAQGLVMRRIARHLPKPGSIGGGVAPCQRDDYPKNVASFHRFGLVDSISVAARIHAG